MIPDSLYTVQESQVIKVQQNDRLNIIVGSKSPELTAPFNFFSGSYRVDENANISTAPATATTGRDNEYVVDQKGNIEFPILGTLYVEGLTINGVGDLIKNLLVAKNLVNDPLVKVNLLNFKITIMGEVANVGVLSVPENRITLFDAISRSGGLTDNATPSKIAVIREENGERKITMNDIQSISVFNSPTYYLKQNDIVYVVPKSGRTDPREERFWRYFGTATGLISLVFTFMIWSK
jgi:polysaccharide export outer membrane protein